MINLMKKNSNKKDCTVKYAEISWHISNLIYLFFFFCFFSLNSFGILNLVQKFILFFSQFFKIKKKKESCKITAKKKSSIGHIPMIISSKIGLYN